MAFGNVARIAGASKVRRRRIIDLTGRRYGRLVVTGLAALADKYEHHRWAIRCDCGSTGERAWSALRAARSCGCLAREALIARNTSHGLSREHRGAYRSWKDMRGRCNCSTDTDYADYGGRGIAVCEEWNDFARFLADMGPRPPRMSIDRIDVNGNYEPGNCRWADAMTQANNKRSNVRLELCGEVKTLSEWCAQYAIERTKVSYRLKIGWPLAKALRSDIDGRNSATSSL